MEIEFIKSNLSKVKPKATIHLSGRLGFNVEGSNLIKLDVKKSYLFGKDKHDARKIYLLESTQDGAVKASKAGSYFYLNAADVFDELKLDYRSFTIMFDISKSSYDNSEIIVLAMREPKRRRKTEIEENI